jgi:hypothetical protein
MAKTTGEHWLVSKINDASLINLGFETVKIDNDGFGKSRRSGTTINNLADVYIKKVYYFAPLDVVVLLRDDDKWCLYMNSELDSFWYGNLTTMSDVVSVLILLFK